MYLYCMLLIFFASFLVGALCNYCPFQRLIAILVILSWLRGKNKKLSLPIIYFTYRNTEKNPKNKIKTNTQNQAKFGERQLYGINRE